MNVVHSRLWDALAQAVASLEKHDGTTGLGGKGFNTHWAPPICQVNCQVFSLHSLSLVLVILPGSLFYRQVVGESEKLGNFLKAWNGTGPRWKSWSVWASAPSIYHMAHWGQLTRQFLRDCMGNAAHCCVLGAWKKLYKSIFLYWRLKERGSQNLTVAGEGSTSGGLEHIISFLSWPSWGPWDAPWRKGHTCYVISG